VVRNRNNDRRNTKEVSPFDISTVTASKELVRVLETLNDSTIIVPETQEPGPSSSFLERAPNLQSQSWQI